jgi:hypothetical protein
VTWAHGAALTCDRDGSGQHLSHKVMILGCSIFMVMPSTWFSLDFDNRALNGLLLSYTIGAAYWIIRLRG